MKFGFVIVSYQLRFTFLFNYLDLYPPPHFQCQFLGALVVVLFKVIFSEVHLPCSPTLFVQFFYHIDKYYLLLARIFINGSVFAALVNQAGSMPQSSGPGLEIARSRVQVLHSK